MQRAKGEDMPAGRTIWDFWADRYEGLWAQHFSLRPSRELMLARLVEVLPEAPRVLDMGCGIGQFASELAEQAPDARILGVDPAAGMIARAEQDYARANVEYRHGLLDGVQRGDGFDAVTCMHAFPYIPDKPAALAHIRSLLRPGGRVLIIQANSETVYDLGFLLFVKLTTTRATYDSAAGLHGLMQGAGFQPGVVRPIDSPFFIPSIQLVEGVL